MRALGFSSLSHVYQLASLISFLAIGPFQPNFPESVISNIMKLSQVLWRAEPWKGKGWSVLKEGNVAIWAQPPWNFKGPSLENSSLLGEAPVRACYWWATYFKDPSHGGPLLLFSLVSKVILYICDLWNCTFLIRHMWEKQKEWTIWRLSGHKFIKPMCSPMHAHETIWCNNP